MVRRADSPNRRDDGQIAGLVLSFTNVTAFRASLDLAVYERESTKAIINTVADPLVVLSSDLRIQSANRAFFALFEVSRDETQGLPLADFGDGAFALVSLRQRLGEMLEGSDGFRPWKFIKSSPPRVGARFFSTPVHCHSLVMSSAEPWLHSKTSRHASWLKQPRICVPRRSSVQASEATWRKARG